MHHAEPPTPKTAHEEPATITVSPAALRRAITREINAAFASYPDVAALAKYEARYVADAVVDRLGGHPSRDS